MPGLSLTLPTVRFEMVIDKQLNNGNNGQTKHWGNSHSKRKEWEQAVGHCEPRIIDPAGLDFIDKEFCKVGLIVTRVFSGRQRAWDPDSILRGDAKQLIDSLVACGWIKDDSSKYVAYCIGLQEKSHESYTKVGFVHDCK